MSRVSGEEVTVKLTRTQISMIFYMAGLSSENVKKVGYYWKQYYDLLNRLNNVEECKTK